MGTRCLRRTHARLRCVIRFALDFHGTSRIVTDVTCLESTNLVRFLAFSIRNIMFFHRKRTDPRLVLRSHIGPGKFSLLGKAKVDALDPDELGNRHRPPFHDRALAHRIVAFHHLLSGNGDMRDPHQSPFDQSCR